MNEIRCEKCIWHDDDDEKDDLWDGKVYCCNLDSDVDTDHRCAQWLNERGEDAAAFLQRQYNEERNREALKEAYKNAKGENK